MFFLKRVGVVPSAGAVRYPVKPMVVKALERQVFKATSV
jgi:hypothetical protein